MCLYNIRQHTTRKQYGVSNEKPEGRVHMDDNDYKKLTIELIKRINDSEMLKSLFYIIQKLCKGL